ncbi:bifunctional UDP-sugar hydrolase/5'-nucleotidase [Parashewanella spongiae]|uniref:Bifunctional UDP-sugar hydrolase/5'-nucleotidase n=1 Tax=Parashewanella spongiae TaxID=342950 RepID=A0A3A6TLM3_9GAMM|nr:bifunctional UDP-sugar hydrolase/5'-nucleotidase UshA [Parashewanella spongiae]MCL1077612.1 bifunctional UDP-sugar hydrolase/5'-nucleotidase UshA [Parashewanella spongiae]RJY13160.1 bifunctional UDP-sugar hydrolase/5'-nucleotidase [Parashewanella spongiae]
MKNTFSKGIVVSAIMIALSGCGGSSNRSTLTNPATCADAGDACVKFTIMHTNDNHGRFWENSDGEYGMAARKALIDSIRTEVRQNGGETLLLSGGDINTGIPESDLQDAEPDFVGMNAIGYNAMAVGNHEFDNALTVVEKQREWANFPMLSANIYKTENDTLVRYFDPYKVFTIGSLRIAVVGLTTEDTETIGNPQFIGDLTFTKPTDEIKKVISEIKANDEADLIFAVTHMGHYADAAFGSNAPGDVSMARELPEGDLAAIIGGHSQVAVCMESGTNTYANFKAGDACTPDQQNGTYIMQARDWGKFVGRADFEYFNGKLNLASYKLIPVNLKEEDSNGNLVTIGNALTPNITLRDTLKVFQDKIQPTLEKEIANISEKLEGDRKVVRNQQTNLGHFIAAAQKSSLDDVDFAILNSGGVRASIKPGVVKVRNAYIVQPFNNSVNKVTMTGSDIARYLGSVATIKVGSGGYAQIINVNMSVNCDKPTEPAIINSIGGETFSPTEKYSFTIPSFSVAGGDKYPNLRADDNNFQDAEIFVGKLDVDVLRQFLESESAKDSENGIIDLSPFEPNIEDITYEGSNNVNGCETQ